jgi:predicted alpha/beta hydrolase
MKESVGRGVAAGLTGTVLMTAFQRWIEMPLSGRKASYQPAELVEKVLGRQVGQPNRRRLNYAAHFGVGATWGAAHGALAGAGVRGPWTAAAAFGVLWPADVTSMAVLGLGDPPWRWAGQELAVDVADKLVLALATGIVYEALSRRG